MRKDIDATNLGFLLDKIKGLFWRRNENATAYSDVTWNATSQTLTIPKNAQFIMIGDSSQYYIKNIVVNGLNTISNGYTITICQRFSNPSQPSKAMLVNGGNIYISSNSGSYLNLSVPRQLIYFDNKWYTNFAYSN